MVPYQYDSYGSGFYISFTSQRKVQILNSHLISEVPVIHESTERIISLMWKQNHYGICEFVVKTRKLYLYDGMYHYIDHWKTVTTPLEKSSTWGWLIRNHVNRKNQGLAR